MKVLKNNKIINNLQGSEWYDKNRLTKGLVKIKKQDKVETIQKSNSGGSTVVNQIILFFDREKGDSGMYAPKFINKIKMGRFEPRNEKASEIKHLIECDENIFKNV